MLPSGFWEKWAWLSNSLNLETGILLPGETECTPSSLQCSCMLRPPAEGSAVSPPQSCPPTPAWALPVGTAPLHRKEDIPKESGSGLSDFMSGVESLALTLRGLGLRHGPFPLGSSQSNGIQPTCKMLLCKLTTKQEPPSLPSRRPPPAREKASWTINTRRRVGTQHHHMMSVLDSKPFSNFVQVILFC